MKPISECTVLITGSTDGLGKRTAEWFAQEGARVLLHGRDEEKGQKILEEIENASGNKNLVYYNGDFSSLRSAAELGEEILSNETKIDILINNAGIGGGPRSQKERETSQDGYELRWAVNYLAQILLTEQLLPIIPEGSRIVNVASGAQAELDFEDIDMENNYEGYLAYSRSKLAFVMFTFDLASELEDRGITVNTLHPASLMETNMVSDHFGPARTTVEEGVEAVKYLAVSEELKDVTGEYFEGKRAAKAHPQAYDEESRKKLQEVTQGSLAAYI